MRASCTLASVLKRRNVYRILAVALLGIEFSIATVFEGVPFIRGSLGDVLCVALLYCLVLSWREVPRIPLALGIFGVACAVEVAQLVGLADALGLQPGSFLAIVLGHYFEWADILCYLVGTVTTVALDLWTLRPIAGSQDRRIPGVLTEVPRADRV
ncbi:MAG: DUF2809 domain-containing protein [Deltaproteobacteria bacterium]|nr:DUF2809 domain-containing protein [Deltaproteobacteria bacterium]